MKARQSHQAGRRVVRPGKTLSPHPPARFKKPIGTEVSPSPNPLLRQVTKPYTAGSTYLYLPLDSYLKLGETPWAAVYSVPVNVAIRA